MPQKQRNREEFYESNNYGTVKVVENINTRYCIIEFLNTGFQKKVHWANVFVGKMKDDSVVYQPPKVEMCERRESNNCGWFTILWKQGKKCFVQFDHTGFTREANIDNARVGKVTDPYYPVSYGVGYLGEPADVPYKKQAYQLWRNMLKRCYCAADPRGYYGKGVSIDSRWLCFANFLEDVPKLKNFEKWLNGHKKGQPKFNLDKDLLVEGNKVYSREMCQFISEYENKSAGGVNRQKLGWTKK